MQNQKGAGKKPTVKIVQDEEPIAKNVLARAVVHMSEAANELLRSGLIRDDIVALIQRRCSSVSKTDVSSVLDAIDTLARTYGR